MWNLLAPIIGAGISGGFQMAGANANRANQNRWNMINMASQVAQNDIDRAMTADQFRATMRNQQRQFNKSMNMSKNQFAKQIEEANIDRAMQREFAQNGVQWRVNDAKAAGLHPLAALGMQGMSSSPISISGNVPSGTITGSSGVNSNSLPSGVADNSMGNAMASFGQDISRAISATATEWERQKEVTRAAEQLSLENQALQNKLLASQVAKVRGAAIGPSMPSSRTVTLISGQGNSPSSKALVDRQPGQSTNVLKNRPAVEPFDFPDTGFSRTETGYAPTMSDIVKQRTEDDIFSEIPWHIRNRVLPQSLGGAGPPAHVQLKPGQSWKWNGWSQEWRIKDDEGPLFIRVPPKRR